MGRLREFGLKAAYYFGIRGHPGRQRRTDEPEEPADWRDGIRVFVVVVVVFAVRDVLGFDEGGVAGFLLTIGLTVVVVVVLGLLAIGALRKPRGRAPKPPGSE